MLIHQGRVRATCSDQAAELVWEIYKKSYANLVVKEVLPGWWEYTVTFKDDEPKTLHEVDKPQLGVSADQLLKRAQTILGEGLGLAVKVSDHEWVDLFLDVGMYLNTQKAPVETKNNNIQEG